MMNLKKDKDIVLLFKIVISMLLLSFLLNELNKYIVQKEIDKKKKTFTDGHGLICSQTAFNTKYFILNEKGWYLYGKYVTNGENVYKLTDCTTGE